MTELHKGAKGSDVEVLQLMLRALNLYSGDVDGIFGDRTEEAVRDFQDDVDQLEVDGVVGLMTWGALRQALWTRDPGAIANPSMAPAPLKCSDDTWQQFKTLVDLVTKHPVVYGPGRGLWENGRFIITYGPGGLNRKTWKSQTGANGPSFHCSSWTNFVMGVLSRRNEDYTHAGNIPALRTLCEAPNREFDQKGAGTWRGYADICIPVVSNGSTKKRSKVPGATIIDLRELWERRSELPTFFVCGQSTRKADGKWKWWHHTVLYVIDHNEPGLPMHRIAADGRVSASGHWSARPMKYTEITENDIEGSLGKLIFRGYSLNLAGVENRPIVPVEIEA
ncbi:peptidoglycan-binding domain-containing protein [Nannocystaceae bacterium ST9]